MYLFIVLFILVSHNLQAVKDMVAMSFTIVYTHSHLLLTSGELDATYLGDK
jgi:hypothetical protein